MDVCGHQFHSMGIEILRLISRELVGETVLDPWRLRIRLFILFSGTRRFYDGFFVQAGRTNGS